MLDIENLTPPSESAPKNENYANAPESQTEEAGTKRGADSGARYNKQGQMVFNVGGVNVTTQSAKKAADSIYKAAYEKIRKLIQDGKYQEAKILAEKIFNTPIDQILKFAISKGIIKEEDVNGTPFVSKNFSYN